MSINQATLLGRLTKNPELKYLPNGSPVCSFSVATSEKYTKDGEKKEKTEFHNCVVWGKLAELCNQYLEKGRQVYLQGKLQTRSWDDKNGQKRYTTEINVEKVEFIGQKSDSNGQQQTSDNQQQNDQQNFSSDDIAF